MRIRLEEETVVLRKAEFENSQAKETMEQLLTKLQDELKYYQDLTKVDQNQTDDPTKLLEVIDQLRNENHLLSRTLKSKNSL